MKKCTKCGLDQPLALFSKDAKWCKPCWSVYHRQDYLKTRHLRQAKLRKMKSDIFTYYGNKCVCCGIDNPKFLTIDHIYNDGHILEKSGKTRLAGTTIYPKIVKNNYPNYYQLLCWNCNCGKAYNNNICPHKTIAA